jgi:hypothetical protein
MIDFDESAGLDEGLEFHEEIDLTESAEGDDGLDPDCMPQIFDFLDSELSFVADNMGRVQIDEDCYVAPDATESILGTYLPDSDIRMLIPAILPT